MYDTIVIGAGAAGMTAALNVLRNGKTVLIIEKELIGGQIANSPRVENFPSIKEISGEEFSTNLFDQVTSLGADFELEEVLSVEKSVDIFKVVTNYASYEARTVVIATGAEHNKLNVPGEDLKGVSYCALCDGAFYKGEDVAVIGDANSALQYALLLSNYAKTVHFCMLFDRYFGDKILSDRLEEKANVIVHRNISLQKIYGDEGKVQTLNFLNTQTNEEFNLDVKAVFIAIGQSPKTDIFDTLVDRFKGYILTDEDMQTKTDGLYAIGDVRMKKVRQLTTAVSDAAIAAFAITKKLS